MKAFCITMARIFSKIIFTILTSMFTITNKYKRFLHGTFWPNVVLLLLLSLIKSKSYNCRNIRQKNSQIKSN